MNQHISLCVNFIPPPPYLEIVPKGPGTQHLKEGVVVDVLPYVVQVVVLAPGADAFLSVCCPTQPSHRVGGVYGVQEDGLELGRKGPKG